VLLLFVASSRAAHPSINAAGVLRGHHTRMSHSCIVSIAGGIPRVRIHSGDERSTEAFANSAAP
jgi:hypothetical protein